ncbi:MAG: hypothetical protein ABIF09_10760 [Gemmatimonadota bacterium]
MSDREEMLKEAGWVLRKPAADPLLFRLLPLPDDDPLVFRKGRRHGRIPSS